MKISKRMFFCAAQVDKLKGLRQSGLTSHTCHDTCGSWGSQL